MGWMIDAKLLDCKIGSWICFWSPFDHIPSRWTNDLIKVTQEALLYQKTVYRSFHVKMYFFTTIFVRESVEEWESVEALAGKRSLATTVGADHLTRWSYSPSSSSTSPSSTMCKHDQHQEEVCRGEECHHQLPRLLIQETAQVGYRLLVICAMYFGRWGWWGWYRRPPRWDVFFMLIIVLCDGE